MTSFLLLQPVHLTGMKYLLRGLIHVDSSLLPDSPDVSSSIKIDIFNRSNVHVDTVDTRHVPNEIEQSGLAILEYTMWSDLGEEFIIVPRHSR